MFSYIDNIFCYNFIWIVHTFHSEKKSYHLLFLDVIDFIDVESIVLP